MPPLLNNVLEQLGWNNGMYIPVANEENKILEELLDKRNKELQQLKEEVALQNSKNEELEYHRKNIQNEHKKNMQLLAVYKEALNNEDHHDKLVSSEISKITQDIAKFKKESNEINERSECIQSNIATVLKKIEKLRNSVTIDKESLDKWQEVLKRSEEDVITFNNFAKEDNSLIHELEVKRQRLKQEHDKKHHNLVQLCGNLAAEEKSAERISEQIIDALIQRRLIMKTWSEAIENLRQRDKSIEHMKQELEMYHQYTENKKIYAKEKQEFLDLQKENNSKAEKELSDLKNNVSQKKEELKNITDNVKALEHELICSKRELMNMTNELNDCRLENKKICKEIKSKDIAIEDIRQQISKYKEKLLELTDGSKTAMQRLNQLEDMVYNEEKYSKQIITETERTQHRLQNAQRILASLKEEEDKCEIDIKGYKSSAIHLDGIWEKIQKELLVQEENLYNINFKIENAKTRLARLEGENIESIDYKMLQDRAEQLQEVLNEKQTNNDILRSQIIKLEGGHRLIERNISTKKKQFENLENRLKELIAETDGASFEVNSLQKANRSLRADLSGLQLQVSHAERYLKKINSKGDSVAKAHLDLNTAVNERTAETNERQAVYLAQKRIVQEEHGKLVFTINLEQNKLEQLKKRYEIYVSTLGEDENGEVLSVAYFKIKNAQEKMELQQEGDNLDAQIKKGEKEIAALEATLQVVDATNRKFVRSLDTVKEDDPEVIEYNALCSAYNDTKEMRAQLILQVRNHSKQVENAQNEIKDLEKHIDRIQIIRDDLIDELKVIKKDLSEQMEKLGRASDYRKKTGNSARKKIRNLEIWNIHEKDVKSRELYDANRSAEAQLRLLNAPIINKRALEYGINLPQSFSAPSDIKLINTPSNASVVSEQESWMQPSSEDAFSNRSVSCEEAFSETSESKKKSSSQTSRVSVKEIITPQRKNKTHNNEGNYAPISVVVLGIDSPSTSNISTKKNQKTDGKASSTVKISTKLKPNKNSTS